MIVWLAEVEAEYHSLLSNFFNINVVLKSNLNSNVEFGWLDNLISRSTLLILKTRSLLTKRFCWLIYFLASIKILIYHKYLQFFVRTYSELYRKRVFLILQQLKIIMVCQRLFHYYSNRLTLDIRVLYIKNDKLIKM